MDDILIGIIAILIGAAVCFYGLRLWFALLPLWGFVVGFVTGATVVTAIFGDSFLSTVTGWVVGVGVGIVFALLSYAIWYVGAILAAGSVGALFGSGLGRVLTIEREWILFILAAAVAVLFILAALMLALPVYVVIGNTAAAGAVALTAGAMLVLNRIDLDEFDNGAAWAMIQESWLWLIVWAVLFVAGISYQLRSMASVVLPENRWTRVAQP